jgi:ribosomal protein L29
VAAQDMRNAELRERVSDYERELFELRKAATS